MSAHFDVEKDNAHFFRIFRRVFTMFTVLIGIYLIASTYAILNVWCEIQNTDYQASKSAKAKGVLPTCRLNQIQKLCKLTLAATRA